VSVSTIVNGFIASGCNGQALLPFLCGPLVCSAGTFVSNLFTLLTWYTAVTRSPALFYLFFPNDRQKAVPNFTKPQCTNVLSKVFPAAGTARVIPIVYNCRHSALAGHVFLFRRTFTGNLRWLSRLTSRAAVLPSLLTGKLSFIGIFNMVSVHYRPLVDTVCFEGGLLWTRLFCKGTFHITRTKNLAPKYVFPPNVETWLRAWVCLVSFLNFFEGVIATELAEM